MPQESLVHELAERFSAIKDLLNEHLKDNDNELLAHNLFFVITKWVMAEFEQSSRNTDAKANIAAILDMLEQAYEDGDSGEQNVIAASFLENLPFLHQPLSDIRHMLGPALREQYDLIQGVGSAKNNSD